MRSIWFLAVALAACGGNVALGGNPGDSGPTEGSSSSSSGGTDASSGGTDARPPPTVDASVDAAGASIDAATPFGWMKQAMVGTWTGTRTDPWDPPATVTITLDASGSYSAHCVGSDPNCSVWHYGTDADLPNKTYQLFDLHTDGTGEAYIEIAFSATEVDQGTLDNIAIDPNATMMNLDFYPTWSGRIGPVHLALVRQ